jgi:hypothetical protein
MASQVDLAVEDWVDVWFEIQNELGVEVNWRLGWTAENGDDPMWINLDHRKFDGVGGFLSILKKGGWPIESVPMSREEKRPSAFRMIVELIRQEIAKRRLQPVKWRDETGNMSTDGMQRFVHGFSEEDTKTVISNAKAAGVSVNTFLLFHLNQSIQKNLLVVPGDNVWLVPVNLRGPLRRKDISSNHVSFFPIRIKPSYDVARLGELTQTNIKRMCHWVSWYFINAIGKKRGRDGVYAVVKKNLDAQRSLVGVFTNLGIWPPPESHEGMKGHAEQLGERKTWFVSANNTPAVPVGGGAVTWFGRLGISVQVHPSVAGNQAIGQEIIKDWTSRLIG